jgi:hypothetical protein
MDIERTIAEAAAKPDRPFATLRDDYPALRGGQATGMSGRQPSLDGTLYLQGDNPLCTLDKHPIPFPG